MEKRNRVVGTFTYTIKVDSDDWECWGKNLTIGELKGNVTAEILGNFGVFVNDLMKHGIKVFREKVKFAVMEREEYQIKDQLKLLTEDDLIPCKTCKHYTYKEELGHFCDVQDDWIDPAKVEVPCSDYKPKKVKEAPKPSLKS